MANLKEIRTRISSVESTMQITSAMKMVSAAKLKRAQDAITQMRPFAKKFNDILLNVSGSVDGGEHPLMKKSSGNKVLLIAFSSKPSSSSACPKLAHIAITSQLYVSFNHGIMIDVSSPPE